MRFVLLGLILLSSHTLAQVRPFQTARLQSTAGAGVASLLVTEAAVLNPASLAFFADTFASYQNTRSSLKNENDDRDTSGVSFPEKNLHEGYFLFDNSTAIKGGFSYQYQREGGFRRRRGTASFASPIKENLSVGLLYRYTEDTRPDWYSERSHKVSHPFALGLSWVQSAKLIFGAVWDDPSNATRDEARAVLGTQYNVTDDLLVMLDAGGDTRRAYLEKSLWRVAAQYNLFADFFVRAGTFQDKASNLRGEAWGVSWTGPKLGIDVAMKSSRQNRNEDGGALYSQEKLMDFSFALSVRY